jgi:hypothetical protein
MHVEAVNNMLNSEVSNIEAHLKLLSKLGIINCPALNSIPQRDNILLSLEEFYNKDNPLYLRCVVQTLFHKLNTRQYPFVSSKFHDNFKNIKTINWDSVRSKWNSADGISSTVSLHFPSWSKDIENFALVKLQQEGLYNNEALLHDIVIGLIINEMRDYLPCFMYTYGGMYCSYPTEDEMTVSDYSNLCMISSDMHTVCLSEYIPTVSGMRNLYEFLINNTVIEQDKIKVILLILFSLAEADRRFKFTHGDLHLENIMIRVLPAEKTFNFVYTDMYTKEEYECGVTTKYVPMIIDYGRSLIKYEGYNIRPLEQKDVILKDKWCIGERDKSGDNCIAEDLIYKGAYVPGYDTVNLLRRIKRLVVTPVGGIGELLKIFKDCFYGNNFDSISGGPWDKYLKGNINNYLRFQRQTLNKSTDLLVQCGVFLSTIANNPILSPLLNNPTIISISP